MKVKSVLAVFVVTAGLLFSALMPQEAAAACICGATRFTANGSAVGNTCSVAQSNLVNILSFTADSSCMSRGFSSACNVVIRTGACSPDPFGGGVRVDGSVKYSCAVCTAAPQPLF